LLKGEHTLAEFAASMGADAETLVASINRFRAEYQGGLPPVGPEHRMFSCGVACIYYGHLNSARAMLEAM
jgi:hypothetical protein